MKRLSIKTAMAVGAMALSACSTQEFSDNLNADSGSDRKNEYTKKWIERFGLFDTGHDWTTLTGVKAEISGEFGADAVTQIYNADPSAGGHLIGFTREPGRLMLDLPKGARSVYAVVSDAKGETLVSGEFDVEQGGVTISAAQAHTRSRAAHNPSYFEAMVVCEDLGGIGDYDFNDIVLGLRHVSGTNTLKIMPMAAGGTLEADVYYKDTKIGEIHEMIEPGSPASSMLNTTTFSKIGAMQKIEVPKNFCLTSDWKNISLKVKDADGTVEIGAPDREGEAPQMFCLGGDWYWPTEKTPIDDAYDDFSAWAADASADTWADAGYDDSKVVKWDVSQVATNWFSGTTSDGSAYSAKINGSNNVSVNSNQIYDLDPPTSLVGMFNGNTSLTGLDVAADHFDTSLVSDMSSAFSRCSGLLKLDLSNWDTGNVTDMDYMFNGCTSLTELDLSGMNTAKLVDVNMMFYGCDNLQKLDLSGWNINSIGSTGGMFTSCPKLETVIMDGLVNSKATSALASIINTLGAVKTISMKDCDFRKTEDLRRKNGTIYYGLFNGLSSLKSVDASGWIAPDLTTLAKTFQNCSGLTDITGIGSWQTAGVTSLREMFYGCSSLQNLDLSNWDTGYVTDMGYMFKGCTSLTNLDLSGMNTIKLNDVLCMFDDCENLQKIDISGWNLTSLSQASAMFNSCPKLETVIMDGLVNSKATSALASIINSLDFVKTISMQNCNFGKTEDLRRKDGTIYFGLFNGRSSLTSVNVTGWITPDLTTLAKTFQNCSSLTDITGIKGWNIPKVTSLGSMFYGCSSLQDLDLSDWDTGSVTEMDYMFYGCKAFTELNLSGMNTAGLKDVSCMFENCENLKKIDLSRWNITNISSTTAMFKGCTKLETVNMDRLTNAKATSGLASIIYTLPSVKTISMKNCNFSKTEDLLRKDGTIYYGPFYGRKALTSVDVTEWITPDLKTLAKTFGECNALTDIIGINSWNVSGVTDMTSMFYNCTSLQDLDLSNWNTGSVTDMDYMFYGCGKLRSLNLTGWNLSNDVSFKNMFTGCSTDIILTITCSSDTRDKLSQAKLPSLVKWVIVD